MRPPGPAFWTPLKVAWYRRALARSDYAERVLAALAPLLDGCRSVLDVGAGCGALALPLAARGCQVTALEPAPAMAAALREAAGASGSDRVTVVEAAWGQAPVGPHDLVLCAHVGELVRPGSAFLAAASELARHGVALVCDAAPVGDKLFFGELYPALLGRPYRTGQNGQGEVLASLRALGIRPVVAEVTYRSDQPFADLEDACDFYAEYLGLPPAGNAGGGRAALRRLLQERLVRDGAGWLAPYAKRARVIWWRVAPAGAPTAREAAS
jgi:SAM-dependent methyltransferase